jgi:hypothetical protein
MTPQSADPALKRVEICSSIELMGDIIVRSILNKQIVLAKIGVKLSTNWPGMRNAKGILAQNEHLFDILGISGARSHRLTHERAPWRS